MVKKFNDRIHLHLRNTRRNSERDFFEDNHLEGDVDMYAVMYEVAKAMQRRKICLPMRPDHGHQMLDDLAEIRSVELGILRSL